MDLRSEATDNAWQDGLAGWYLMPLLLLTRTYFDTVEGFAQVWPRLGKLKGSQATTRYVVKDT